MPAWIMDNPALITGLVAAVLAAAAAFGLHLSDDQRNAILALTGAILALTAVAHKATVPKTPSPEAPLKSLQELPK